MFSVMVYICRQIAGLNKTKTKKILEWREKNNGFRNRTELNQIKGLGPKTFEQCAGFVRIMPGSLPSQRSDPVCHSTSIMLAAIITKKQDVNSGFSRHLLLESQIIWLKNQQLDHV